MTLDRTMYEALAGLLKASLLHRCGGAILSDLKTAERIATDALTKHHREYVEGGPSGVQMMHAPVVIVEPMHAPLPSRDRKRRVPKTGRGRVSPAEASARNAQIKLDYAAMIPGSKAVAVRRLLAERFGISAVTIDHIVNGYGAYKVAA